MSSHNHEGGRGFTPPTVATLARCEDEPIHRPGAVQPHGCLFEVRGDSLDIHCVSSNVREVTGLGVSDLLGRPLASLVGAPIAAWAAEQLSTKPPTVHAAMVTQLPQGRAGTLVVHHYSGRRFAEWLEDAEHRFPMPERIDSILSDCVLGLSDLADLESLLQRVAEGVKRATGYDRVMVYRFHPDWHGEIVAEAAEPGLPPYRGLHYPASDIPAQARRLYIETRLRVIADVYARDAVLMDAQSEEVADTLDLSHCVLRSVSPVHIQYLRNMGSGATLVTSLLVDGKLWGLIACHHRSRYPVPHYAFERLRRFTDEAAHLIGLRLRQIAAERRDRFTAGIQLVRSSVNTATADALAQLMALLRAEGAIATASGRTTTIGRAPLAPQDLADAVLAQPDDLGALDRILDRFGQIAPDPAFAGMAWLILSRPYRAAVIFLRPEFQKTVTWGGDPDKAVVRDPVTQRLSPRGSFNLWKQTVSGRSRPWDAETSELLEAAFQELDIARWVGFTAR